MNEGFAAVPTWMIRDQAVSAHALLVYGALASRSGFRSIVPKQETLAVEARCSVRSVRDALKELEALGVVERVARRTRYGHRNTDVYRLLSGPLLVEEELPAPAAGRQSLPAHSSIPTGTHCRVKEIESLEIDKDPSIVSPAAEVANAAVLADGLVVAGFESFWGWYPRKVGKPVALKAFDRAVKRARSIAVVVGGARRLREDPNLPEAQFIPHPSTWLNRDGWEDEAMPPRAVSSGSWSAAAQVDAALAAGAGPLGIDE